MASKSGLPVVFDLDGVWLTSDLSHEMLVLYLKEHPFSGPFHLLKWRLQGKSVIKSRLNDAVKHCLDVESLPVNHRLRDTDIYKSASERALVSGSHDEPVASIAQRDGDFHWSRGTTEGTNLIGAAKAAFLKKRYPQGFAYVGDSEADLDVWAAAKAAYAVRPARSTENSARAKGIELKVIEERPAILGPALRAMRLHQWAKNALIFMLLGLNLGEVTWTWVFLLLGAFLSFGLVASATYMINDIVDVQSDRRHPQKRFRPVASGELGMLAAAKMAMWLMLYGFAIALVIGLPFVAMLAGYTALSLLYSIKLKQIAILDALTLSLLFCWRVATGGVVIGVELLPWLTAAIGFFFFSLALGKRGIELQQKRDAGSANHAAEKGRSEETLPGRGYRLEDYPVVMAMGIVAGIASVVVTLIYALLSPYTIISSPLLAFAVASLLIYWQGYIWMTINRGEMSHDPIQFAIKDPQSLFVLMIMAALIVAGQILGSTP